MQPLEQINIVHLVRIHVIFEIHGTSSLQRGLPNQGFMTEYIWSSHKLCQLIKFYEEHIINFDAFKNLPIS